jgi:hypothetical protein
MRALNASALPRASLQVSLPDLRLIARALDMLDPPPARGHFFSYRRGRQATEVPARNRCRAAAAQRDRAAVARALRRRTCASIRSSRSLASRPMTARAWRAARTFQYHGLDLRIFFAVASTFAAAVGRKMIKWGRCRDSRFRLATTQISIRVSIYLLRRDERFGNHTPSLPIPGIVDSTAILRPLPHGEVDCRLNTVFP